MKWFGKAHGAPYERDDPHVPTPVGEACRRCGELIAADDDGFIIPVLDVNDSEALHYECYMRTIVGGLNHQRKLCVCCGGTLQPDPEGMTVREAAKAALDEHTRTQLAARNFLSGLLGPRRTADDDQAETPED